ncbi:MAG: hypothetical protein ACI9N1_003198 [Flavobacteriales bacterium]|jgi:hypothetical protein
MKKVLLSVAAVATLGLGMTSCGGSMDVEAATKEFCECKDTEDNEKCIDEWYTKYDGGTASEEDTAKMGEDMAKCNVAGVMHLASKVK